MRLADVRSLMPKFGQYGDRVHQRPGPVLGVAIHHSGTAGPSGEPVGDAYTFFKAQTDDEAQGGYGWDHGAWHYVIDVDGTIEYALDEETTGYHAGLGPPPEGAPDYDNRVKAYLQLEDGQYWNHHYLAICLVGDLSRIGATPTLEQWQSLVSLIADLRWRYDIPIECIRGHRELMEAVGQPDFTDCPGNRFDMGGLRARLAQERPRLQVEWIAFPGAPSTARVGSTLAFSAVLRNMGNCAWAGRGAIFHRVALRYHWFDAVGQLVATLPQVGEYLMLSREVRVGQLITLNNLGVPAPLTPGEHTLRMELIALDEPEHYEYAMVHCDLPVRIES